MSKKRELWIRIEPNNSKNVKRYNTVYCYSSAAWIHSKVIHLLLLIKAQKDWERCHDKSHKSQRIDDFCASWI